MWYPELSVSLERLGPEEMKMIKAGRDPRRTPIINSSEMLESLLSLSEEEVGSESADFLVMEDRVRHPPSYSSLPAAVHVSLTKSVSMSGIEQTYLDAEDEFLYSEEGGSSLSVNAESAGSQLDLTLEDQKGTSKPGGSLERTLSFLKKMAGKTKNKEKERVKEKEKESREREARYTNGHLFNCITVSGTTLCYACNKSITAKEALSCPNCSVTIHNRCRDALPNCTKVKQKQQKLALVRNSPALQTVALRNKSPMIRERPNSAIYPSDSLRQSFLGSRRGRSGLSLSKSVSTNNIAGNLNEDSPLGLRRILSQSTDSLNFRNRALSVESLNDEGELFYTQVISDLEAEGKDFEADSWSLVVDTNFLQQQRKDVMKRQDVIYELIQTELHHVRTLKIMSGIFRRGMIEDLHLDSSIVHGIFPCLDELEDIHTNFLSQLLLRRKESLASGSDHNFVIMQLGDILIQQFSGESVDQMRKAYVEFCSRHLKSLKLYKELLTKDKKFQQFVRRVSRGALLRRHGIQECILLVTQRITKYPVLIDRILQNTKGNEEDGLNLQQALVLIRELLSSIDQEVHDLEKTQRLQEIHSRLDQWAETNVQGNQTEITANNNRSFRSGELLRRKLLHEGPLLLKTGSRFKDVHVLLMTDILVFLQEKDLKYNFASLDKPPVISLMNLILRDIANQEKGLFLISNSSPPVMYEIYTNSRDDRSTWMKNIHQAVTNCPRREEFPLIETEDEAHLRSLRDAIHQKNKDIVELLEERVSLFSEVAMIQAKNGVNVSLNSRNLFRAETPEAVKGEKILMEAINEVDRLCDLLVGPGVDASASILNEDQNQREAPEGEASPSSNGEEMEVNGTNDLCKTLSSTGQKDRNGNVRARTSSEEVLRSLLNLDRQLHALQGAVVQQDSVVELCQRELPTVGLNVGSERGRDKLTRSLSGGLESGMGSELVLLQRQHALLQDELSRTRGSEARLRESEKSRAELEKQLRETREQCASLQAQLDRIRLQQGSTKKSGLVRKFSLPTVVDLASTTRQDIGLRRGSEDDPSTAGTMPAGEGSEETDHSEMLPGESDPELNSEEEDADELSARSSSPREFQRMQDIPEESEAGTEQRDPEPKNEDQS
ncbi:rho guanine nucleotide exchange factor 1a isoform X2 [Erpetoichthys calabaricus]|uniref:rho guanine nucleotide exchange factor 1a isoform X2 n=1 Tax=Erpetoichthys calabaricus TaxID=27687 RepID=UPI0010A00E33|nr:rho guanine nucleotide exchange factor 1a isoform X2 [Erpetoichthys calabaricus]